MRLFFFLFCSIPTLAGAYALDLMFQSFFVAPSMLAFITIAYSMTRYFSGKTIRTKRHRSEPSMAINSDAPLETEFSDDVFIENEMVNIFSEEAKPEPQEVCLKEAIFLHDTTPKQPPVYKDITRIADLPDFLFIEKLHTLTKHDQEQLLRSLPRARQNKLQQISKWNRQRGSQTSDPFHYIQKIVKTDRAA